MAEGVPCITPCTREDAERVIACSQHPRVPQIMHIQACRQAWIELICTDVIGRGLMY